MFSDMRLAYFVVWTRLFRTTFKMFLCFVVLISAFISRRCEGVQINYLKVPQAVRNNSGISAVLDCNYSVRPDDTELVVKWFLNGELVYQWVPPHKPRSLGVLSERLELNFAASEDPNALHRAMKVLNPTTDIAGDYKCLVSTFADEDFTTKTMIVFEPESVLDLQRGEPNEGRVNFTCVVADVFPQPKIILYKDKKDDMLEPTEWKTRKHQNGKYSVILISNVLLSDLDDASLIFCELRIPGTGYVRKKNVLYYPDSYVENWNGCVGSSLTKDWLFLYLIVFGVTILNC